MGQIVPTTNQLIINSLYLLGELGVGETPDSFMLSSGLELLNELLNKFCSDSIYIPYLYTLDFTLEQGKDTYSASDIVPADFDISRIIDLSFANYQIPSTGDTAVVYPIRIISKATYYGVVRQTNLQSRPGFIFLNKQANESFVVFYPIPDQAYPCQLQLKLMLQSLSSQDDLSQLPPQAYGFLKYALARKFLSYYPSNNWPQANEDEYQDYYNIFKIVNETDVTLRPSQILTTPEPFYWPNILSF